MLRAIPLPAPATAVKGGSGFASAYAGKIAVQGTSVYITGNFTNVFALGSFAIASSGNKDIFLASLETSTGNCNWLEKAGGAYNDIGLSITPAASGGFFTCGTFNSTATFGTQTVTSSSIVDDDIYFARYDAGGSCTWVKRIGSTGTDIANTIKEMPNGDILLGGSYEGSVQFGPGVTLNSVAFSDLFLAKFNATGSLIWAKSAGGENTDVVYSLGYDQAGDIFITGFIADTANFGSIVVNNPGNIQVYVAKYSSAGVPLWVRFGGNTNDDIGYDLTVDNGGSVYVAGYLNGNANFGGTPVTGVQANDIFIVKYDPSGTLRWITRAGGATFDRGKAIIHDTAGFCYVAGDFSTTSFFGTIQTMTNNPGDYEVFLTRVGGGSVGLEENDPRYFSFYPNPVSEKLFVNLSEIQDAAFTLEALSVDGKVVHQTLVDANSNKSAYEIPVNRFAKGSYLLRISTSSGDFSRTFIVK